MRRAVVCFRAFLKLAACAFPRPSATASAKFANKTVNQSQSASCATNARCPGSALIKLALVRIAPTSVTAMTGFLIMTRG